MTEIRKKSRGMTAVILIGIVVLFIVFVPLAGIWALNTLFGLTIAYTFKTWLAALVLAVLSGGRSTSAVKQRRSGR